MLDKNQTSKIVNFAKAHPDISAIYLFGSHAIGHPRSKNDIDLGILFILTEKTLLSEQVQSSLAMPGNTTWENWSIGMRIEDYNVFLFCF